MNHTESAARLCMMYFNLARGFFCFVPGAWLDLFVSFSCCQVQFVLTSGSYSVLLFSLFSWSIVKCCLIPRYHIVAGFLNWYGGIGPVNCCCITCCCCSILQPNHGTVHMPDPSQKGSLSFEFLQFHQKTKLITIF